MTSTRAEGASRSAEGASRSAETVSISALPFARIVAAIRLRQMRGSKRTGVVLAAVASVGVVMFFVMQIVTFHWMDDGLWLMTVVLVGVIIGWTVIPVLLGGGLAAIDPRQFALYPLDQRTINFGLLVAAFLSFPAVVTSVTLVATVIFAPSWLSRVAVLVAAALIVVTCVLSAQCAVVLFNRYVQRSSTRAVTTVVGSLLAMSVALLPQGLSFMTASPETERRVVGAAKGAMPVVEWLPVGWAPAMFAAGVEQRWFSTAMFGLLAAAWIGVVFAVWSWATKAEVITRPTAPERVRSNTLVAPWEQRLFGRSESAVVARTFKEFWRDTRQLQELAGFLPILVVSAVPAWNAIRTGDDRLVLSSAAAGLAVGFTASNAFGYDGLSFGADLLASRDLGMVLRGKQWARFLMAIVIVPLMAIIFAAVTGGWRYVPMAVVMGATGAAMTIGTGALLSVRFPYAMPPRAGVSALAYNPGCLPQLVRVVMAFGWLLLLGPIFGPAVYVAFTYGTLPGTVISLVGLALGWLVAELCLRSAGRFLQRRGPELFQTLAVPVSSA